MVNNIWTEFAESYDAFLCKSSLYQELINKIIKSMDSSNLVLDAGCGTGNIAIELAKKRKRVYGIDNNEAMISYAFGKLERELRDSVELRSGDVQNLPFPDSMFEGVVSNNVIFYVDRPKKMLQELYRVLTERGILAISGPIRIIDYAKLIDFTIKEFEERGVYDKQLKAATKKFIETSMELKTDGIRNTYGVQQLEDILKEIGFKKIIKADEETYLGELYFIVAEK
ncbi:MAG: methyltransferase domain-containing protein [Candidatus Woesearchaeota archaeon]